MNAHLIFWPVLAQVFLVVLMFAVLARRKIGALKARQVDRGAAALDNKAWPENVVKVSNNLDNQSQVPVLFYVLCLVAYSAGAVNLALLVLAWVFVVSRYIHAYVHIGSNYVPLRLRLFMAGCTTVLLMLGVVAWGLLQG